MEIKVYYSQRFCNEDSKLEVLKVLMEHLLKKKSMIFSLNVKVF